MKIMLDTNAYSALGRGHATVSEMVQNAEALIVSTVVAGEVLAGFRAGSRTAQNIFELDRFLALPYVSLTPVTRTTADRYSRIMHALRRKGFPIPTNDVWIAAHAMETGADLISFDRHFEQVDGLAWIDPSQ